MGNGTKKVVTRMAPSPTGFFHLGSARTTLFNFLYAKHYGGKFILRIEDTDRERSRKEYEESIFDGIKWMGLSYDECYRQSERTDIYKSYLTKLIENGKAYVSKERAEEGKRSEVIRLKNSGQTVSFRDEIRGDISFDTSELGDFVIAKSVSEPLYHLAVVVDDFESGITHVIRGEDHISNTPRQILIAEAIGAPRPIYAHLPLILAADRSKLSKRHGALALSEYREMGYIPEAMVNFLALLGWSPQGKNADDQEIFFLDDLVKKFDLDKIGKSGAVFNIEKLDWINKEHLKKLSAEKLEDYILKALPSRLYGLPGWNKERFLKVIPILTERIVKFSDITEMSEAGELDFFFKTPEYEIKNLIWGKDSDGKIIRGALDGLVEALKNIPESSFTRGNIKDAVMAFVGEKDRGSILWPMRYGLSGLIKSPDPFVIASIIGKEETLQRMETVLKRLKKN